MLRSSFTRGRSYGAAALLALAPFAPVRRAIPGMAYTIHVTSGTPSGGGSAAAVAGAAQNYTANVIFAAGRGRMDVVAGGVPNLFSKGDYILFEGHDLAIVHPATQAWTPLSHDTSGTAMQQLEANGISMKMSDLEVKLDSLGAGDTVAGHATTRYRMTTAFRMNVDAGFMQSRFAAENTTTYWLASIPGMPGNPLLQPNGFSGGPMAAGAFAELSKKVDSAAARMGSRVALRTRTVSRLILDAPGSNVQTEQTSEVSDLVARPVDERLLILPAGYKQVPLPGMDTVAAAVAARWRGAPGGG
ncbi:MAG TPA: hypothetical protein VHB25_16565 [Gemmatimonadaceae bacterium]|nr:hypothetical protein [Gemmatimonadaceae bacterium]